MSDAPLDRHLSDDLQRLLDEHDGDSAISFGELVDRVGDRGFGFSLLLLSLPSALPVPAPGYSTPFGIAILGLAAQMLMGRSTPWLPQWVTKRELSASFARKAVGTAIAFLRKVEHLIRPRFAALRSRPALVVVGLLVACMGGLMTIPLPGTNTAPAMAIFLVGVGLVEEDGLVVALAAVAAAGAAALYGALFGVMIYAGMEWTEVYDGAKSTIKGLLGRG
jgi:hypothetical protein